MKKERREYSKPCVSIAGIEIEGQMLSNSPFDGQNKPAIEGPQIGDAKSSYFYEEDELEEKEEL